MATSIGDKTLLDADTNRLSVDSTGGTPEQETTADNTNTTAHTVLKNQNSEETKPKSLTGLDTSETEKKEKDQKIVVIDAEPRCKWLRNACDCGFRKLLLIVVLVVAAVLLSHFIGHLSSGKIIGVGFGTAVGAFALTAIVRHCWPMKYNRCFGIKGVVAASG